MSKTITVETIINAPLDEVWDEVSKIENHSNWMKDAVNIDFQTNSRTGVGTKIKVLTKIGPIKLYDYMTFTKWEDKSVIGVDHVGIVKGKGEMQFTKISDTALASATLDMINSDPPLNPNHPNHRMNVPKVARGRFAPGIA